jgi:hypothetical protein
MKKIKSRLNSGNTCYHAAENLFSFRLLSKIIKIRIYKTIILRVVLYGCETWSLTLREEHRLRMFENRVVTRIFGPKRDEVTGGWRKFIMRRSMISTLQIKEDEKGRAGGKEECVQNLCW